MKTQEAKTKLTLEEMKRLSELGNKNYNHLGNITYIIDRRTELEEKEYSDLMRRYRKYGSK